MNSQEGRDVSKPKTEVGFGHGFVNMKNKTGNINDGFMCPFE